MLRGGVCRSFIPGGAFKAKSGPPGGGFRGAIPEAIKFPGGGSNGIPNETLEFTDEIVFFMSDFVDNKLSPPFPKPLLDFCPLYEGF